MLPPELSKPVPRDIDINHELFSKNRSRIRGIFLGSLLIIPLVAVLFWWKFGDLVAGVLWGIGIAAFCELIGVAMLINTRKSVQLMRDGMATTGLVESIQAPPDKQGNAYIAMKVSYSDKLGMRYLGNTVIMGKENDVDRKAGDPLAVLYLEDKPQVFAIYTPGIGISTGRSKVQQ